MKEVGIIGQVRAAMSNPIALLVGCLLGGIVPLATYFVAHHEIQESDSFFSLSRALVAGGLLYSAKTVWQWGRQAFACPYKASGFVLLIEGVMIVSNISWLSTAALCYLIAINAVATGCLLAQKDEKVQAKKVAKKSVAQKSPKASKVVNMNGSKAFPKIAANG